VAVKPSAVPVAPSGLPIVETSRSSTSAGFLTAVELELEFAQPIGTVDELKMVVDGVQELNGVASVRSDGIHIGVRYDSTVVLPARIRDRLRELGHPAVAGTNVQNPGDAAD
jgi:copper chaperone CopZ